MSSSCPVGIGAGHRRWTKLRDKELVRQLDIIETLLAEPNRFGSRFAVTFAAEKAAEACEHSDIFPRGWGGAVDDRSFQNEAGQRLPFVLFAKNSARNIRSFTT